MARLDRSCARAVAAAILAGITVASCGGGGSSRSDQGAGGNAVVASAAPAPEGTPRRGGEITYGLEAKTDNFCLPSAQLAIAGVMVAQSVYDTLTEPDASGHVVPYLAKSVTHDSTYKVWTIALRPGVRFTDGEVLDAAAVAKNIDAWRHGLLLGFVFSNVDAVTAVDPMTVQVTTKVPWVAFPSYLWAFGRVGIAAPRQLDDTATCATNMIGTGPFKVEHFDAQTGAVDVVRNPDYWRKGFPYLDGIHFRVQEDGQQRVTGLQGGQFDVIQDDLGRDFDRLRTMSGAVKILVEPPGYMEISHLLLDVSKPPFDDFDARKALALGLDQALSTRAANGGDPLWRRAYGAFDTKSIGYVSNPAVPPRDVAEAKRLVAQYKATHGGKFQFTLQATIDPLVQATAVEIQRQASALGMDVILPQATDQGTVIAKALGGSLDAIIWRNYAGGDPDGLYVWFHSGSPVNLNHIDDPQVDHDLDVGRSNPDPAVRARVYQDLDRRLTSEAYNLWSTYQTWFIASKPTVHGILGPALPNASGGVGSDRPAVILAGYHQLLGIWLG